VRKFFVLTGALAAVLIIPLAARANCGDTFTVYNEGSHQIYSINVEPSDYNQWGPDLLGNYVLNPGYSVHPLSLYWGANPNIPNDIQDVRVVYSDGTVLTRTGVDICEYNLTFNY
jgi:hypothetical protein